MENKEIIYWDTPDAEQLSYTNKNEAIEGILDKFELNNLPETIEVCGYAEMTPNWAEYAPLNRILESLDEEYGNPEGDLTEPTEAMCDAEKAFLETIIQEYDIWAYEEVYQETINVMEWVKTNRPDWLNQGKII